MTPLPVSVATPDDGFEYTSETLQITFDLNCMLSSGDVFINVALRLANTTYLHSSRALNRRPYKPVVLKDRPVGTWQLMSSRLQRRHGNVRYHSAAPKRYLRHLDFCTKCVSLGKVYRQAKQRLTSQKMKILGLALFTYYVIASTEPPKRPLSNGLVDNVITSVDLRQWVVINLPEQLLSIELDDLRLSCNNGSCKAKNNKTIGATYVQIKDGGHYQNIWPVNNKSCIQPEYSLPLIRSVNESSHVTIQCTIRKSVCQENESIVIFDLNKVFCVYNETVKTCNKTDMGDDIFRYTTSVSNTANNKYSPDQYVFCNSNGSYISTKITWNSDLRSTIIEENTTKTWTPDDQCSCPNSYDPIELPSCKRDAVFECSGLCQG
ncbi:hypothetical protein SprV_0802516400 [Sparganum proliferum]